MAVGRLMVRARLARRPTGCLIVAALVGAGVASAAGAELKMRGQDTLPGAGPAPQVLGLGANPADRAKWPATLVFRNALGGGCTATMVGPRAILTAAHCIDDGAQGSVEVGNTSVTVTCRHHPAYPGDISADFALCLTAAELRRPDQGFERLHVEAGAPSVRDTIILLGYGCLTETGADRNFGALYEGTATVDATPGRDLYFITRGGAAVCFGDSGGGAYRAVNASGTVRRLLGVNSRGDISRYSWISSTATAGFRDWASGWANQNGVAICGLSAGATGCRQ